MDKASVVTDSYIKALEGKKVLDAIFTTYTLDIDFFEAEVLWILTGHDMNKFSPNNDVRRRELAHYFQKNKLPVSVFFDRKVNDWDSDEIKQTISPLIEYLLVPVHSGNNAFHPKVTLLLLEDNETKERSILYASGSNNLTYPGWWENVECVNIELLADNGIVSKSLFDFCEKSIEYFFEKRKEVHNDDSAFSSFFEFLRNKDYLEDNGDKYFSSYINGNNFSEFVQNAIALNDYDTLEVISPYFAEKEDTVVKVLEEISNSDYTIKLFLPKNETNELLCTEQLFNKINEEKNIYWAGFKKELQDELQIKTVVKTDSEEHNNIRRVHAKVFHWHNSESKKSIYFTGSVNLSYKAFKENEEAGKLIYIDNGQDLLTKTDEKEPIYANELDQFEEAIEKVDKGANVFTYLSLMYDWKLKKLDANCTLDSVSINDFVLLLDDKELKIEESIKLIDSDKFEKAINSSPYITVQYGDKIQKVFVNQKSFTHKPLDLGNLSVKEILDIYAKFDIETKSNELIKIAIQRALHAKGIESDIDLLNDEIKQKNFFSEYSEIFYGLRHLKSFLLEDASNQDYFLDESTKAMDSIPVLVDETFADKKIDIVSKYITFLYVKQMYKELGRNAEFIDKYILGLKEENEKEFLENEVFIKWFESAFFIKFSNGVSK
jgi:hypothetical protein